MADLCRRWVAAHETRRIREGVEFDRRCGHAKKTGIWGIIFYPVPAGNESLCPFEKRENRPRPHNSRAFSNSSGKQLTLAVIRGYSMCSPSGRLQRCPSDDDLQPIRVGFHRGERASGWNLPRSSSLYHRRPPNLSHG